MTQNAWNTDTLDANGEVLIGNGSNPPTATTITSGTNCNVANSAGGIQFNYTGSTTGDWVLTHSASASASAELTFTGLSSTYFVYAIVIDNYQPGTDGERLNYQLSTDNGSTWDSTSTYYFRGWSVDDTGARTALDSDTTNSNLIGSASAPPGNATNESCSAISYIYNPSATAYTRFTNLNHVMSSSSGAPWILSIESGRENASAVNALRLFNASANIATCEVRIYGLVAS